MGRCSCRRWGGLIVVEHFAENPPVADPGCGSAWPVSVPQGSQFVPAGDSLWITNKTYPAAIRASLEESGYSFRSQSPAEDLLAKVMSIRVEIRTRLPEDVVVAEYTFDARKYFRRTLWGFFRGLLPTAPIVDPANGIDISADAVRRLPAIGFPVLAGPLPAETPVARYRAIVYWTLSEPHNDGLGLGTGNFLPAGEFQYGEIYRLEYVP